MYRAIGSGSGPIAFFVKLMIFFTLDNFDPLKLFLELAPSGPGFLESCGEVRRVGHYSVLPLRVRETWQMQKGELVLHRGGEVIPQPGDPFTTLGTILEQRRIDPIGRSPFPGGFFGYFGYDLAGAIEQLPQKADRDLPVPQLWLAWVDVALVYDHDNSRAMLDSLDPEVDLEQLAHRIRRVQARPTSCTPNPDIPTPQPALNRQQFIERVEAARRYIAAGDIYQANLSCRFGSRVPADFDPATLYRKLRGINPSPFACYLQSPGVTIVSSSPERLVSLRGGIAETRPIAGTRPRGFTPPEDEQLGEELLAHPKERAEHIMLLDLERNDLGKVCRTGSVDVDELMVLERYSHVNHIVSNVRGELCANKGPFDLLRATFPGGTITGVPKKRCMEIIDELEPVGRGTYTGSAGYISATGEMDLNILIRSFQLVGNRLSYQVGAGIVADSDPEREWDECLAKGEAMQLAISSEHEEQTA